MTASIRYDIVRTNFDRLVEAVKPVVVEVAVKAFAKVLISDQNRADAQNSSKNEYDRASNLLGLILVKITENETHFDTFVAILKEVPTLKGVADKLVSEVSHRLETVTQPESGQNRDFQVSYTPERETLNTQKPKGNPETRLSVSLSRLASIQTPTNNFTQARQVPRAGGDYARKFSRVQLNFAVGNTRLPPSIWLIKFQTGGKICLNGEALRLLKTIPSGKPVAVLSICGPYRSGKSFFLSRMLGTNDAFKVSSEMDPCTKGIWMSTIVLECDDFVVVLLDTEGTDAAQESEQFSATDMTKLLVFATLLSSYLIYNTTGAMRRAKVDRMSCFSHIAETILLREGASASDHLHEQNLQRFFPRFLWLLRDNTLKTKVDGKPVSATEYVKKKFLVRSKQEMCPRNEIVRTIVELFPSLECRQTPPPDNPVMKDSTFLTAIDETATFLLDSIHPKESFEHQIPIDGSMLANLMEQYVKALNEPGTVPNIEFSWMEAVKKHLTERCQALVEEYCQEMQQKLQTRLPIEEGDLSKLQTQQPPKTLAGIHQTTFEPKLSMLQNEAARTLPSKSHKRERDEIINVQFKRKIVLVHDDCKIEGELAQFVELYRKLSEQYCNELFDKLCKQQMEMLNAEYFKEAIGPAKKEVFHKRTIIMSTRPGLSAHYHGPPFEVTVDSKPVGKANLTVTLNQSDTNPDAANQYEIHVLVASNPRRK